MKTHPCARSLGNRLYQMATFAATKAATAHMPSAVVAHLRPYELLIEQLWATLPAFFTHPTDLQLVAYFLC